MSIHILVIRKLPDCFRGSTMKKILIAILVLNAIIYFNSSADIGNVDKNKIVGAWVNNDFYYTFDSQGIMKVIKIDSRPINYATYRYEIIAMGDHEFIRYGKDLSDSTSVKFLYMNNITDSTVILGYGMAFVKADSIRGLKGSWKHVDDLSSIYWNIDNNTIDYHQIVLDLKTGELITVEEHHGTYNRGVSRQEAGRFYIDFQDGKKTVVIPIFYKDIMYMFDLSPMRSTFILAESAPTYDDYKEASNKY